MKKRLQPLFLALFALLLLALPEAGVESLRTLTACSFAPFLERLHGSTKPSCAPSEVLQLENQMLKTTLARLQDWMNQEGKIEEGLKKLYSIERNSDDPYYARRGKNLSHLLMRQLHALPAKVVFREPAKWSSLVWIGVGERDNREMDETIVAHNSPVVCGNAIVGVVETVLETRSSVRLLTDRKFNPSVRIVRGGSRDAVLSEKIDDLVAALALRDDLDKAKELSSVLTSFRDRLDPKAKDLYLAKGVLKGAIGTSWGMPQNKLKGVGFNYDFSDEEGTARNLRSTAPPLISVGDVLVTTGLDGIFPPDLYVATVSSIYPLQEGACSYSLEANPIVSNLHALKEVFVLPPVD